MVTDYNRAGEFKLSGGIRHNTSRYLTGLWHNRVQATIVSAFYFGLLLSLLLCCQLVLAKSKLAIGQDVYEKMQEVQARIEAEDFNSAKNEIEDLLANKKLNNYEKAQLYSMKGNLAYQQENFDGAFDAFKTAVTFTNLPEGFLQASLRTLAQLSFMQDKLDDALKFAKQMMAMTTADDAFNHMLLAQIYYKQENLKSALEQVLIALEIERQQGSDPKENWLLIANAIYYGLGQFDNMVPVLKELIRLYPKQTYVSNLAAIYGQLEHTEKQLLLMEPLYDKGLLTHQAELVNLANLMILHKVPFKGAKIIEQGFQSGAIERNKRNLELLAQSWQLAAEEEKSVGYLAEAAKLSQNGENYLRLAQTYIGLYRWGEAEKALEQALALGGFNKTGDALLLLGMVRFYQKDYSQARKAFRLAGDYPNMAKLSAQWLIYLEQERTKNEAAD